MIVCLLVFVSVMLAIAGFTNLRTFGRIGLAVISMFLVLSVFAMFLGWSAYQLFPIGDPDLANSLVDSQSSASSLTSSVNKEDLSIVNIIVNIVPSNVFMAFANADMLQIIFVAVLFGIATIGLKCYSKKIVNALEAINELMLKVTRMIISVMPIAIFFSMLNMALTTDVESMLSVLQWIVLIDCTDITMLCVYLILITIVVRINPFEFLKRFFPSLITGFMFCSSSASLPVSLEIFNRQMGVDKKIYSFSIPLGVTVNMNGSCITQTISVLFFAHVFGVEINAATFVVVCITILFMCIGEPGVAGASLICMSLILPTAGVPSEAIAIIMGVYPLVAMFHTAVNVTGDATVTMMTGKIFKMLDYKK